jgi:undecaprenyl-diphosphatase
MELLQALILGVVQGVGEFLPISSSGHLVIVGELLDGIMGKKTDMEEKLLLNVVLHAGTLLSILVVYREKIFKLIKQPRVCVMIVVASIPAGFMGFMYKDLFEQVFANPLIAGCALFVTAGLLIVGQTFEKSELDYEELPMERSFIIGLFQAGALIPGISRSGSTISGGLLMGLKRDSAAAFSFLMAIPVIGGAALIQAKDVFEGETAVANPLALVVGGVVSFVVGLFVLNWLVNLIAKGKLHYFAYYCIVVGTLTVTWQLVVRMSESPTVAILK